MTSSADSPAVDFRNVDILFGTGTGRRGRDRRDVALGFLDQGLSRAEIAAKTGIVVGVTNANLTVGHGEISVLMGLSGSGKSTLLRAANGLNQVTRGEVRLHDGDGSVDVANCPAADLRRMRMQRVAMVFQQFALLPWRTVRENVGLGLELRGVALAERRRIVDEKLVLVGLDQWADRFAAELSGGMQQRVGLARAFATDADILLMDEPFSALDPLIRTKLQDELLALQSRMRKTIIFVSHDLDEALKLGNHISIMEGGRIVQTGTPEDIVLRPADAYVAEFVGHMNPLSVLRGSAVMRPLERLEPDGSSCWLDPARRYQLSLDHSGRPTTARLDGAPLPIMTLDAPEHVMPQDLPHCLALVRSDLPLRIVVQIRQMTGHPVLVAEDGVLTGICDDGEILAALCGITRRTAGPPAHMSPSAVSDVPMHAIGERAPVG